MVFPVRWAFSSAVFASIILTLGALLSSGNLSSLASVPIYAFMGAAIGLPLALSHSIAALITRFFAGGGPTGQFVVFVALSAVCGLIVTRFLERSLASIGGGSGYGFVAACYGLSLIILWLYIANRPEETWAN